MLGRLIDGARRGRLQLQRKLHREKMLKIVSKRIDPTPLAGMPPGRSRLVRHLGARAALAEVLDGTRTIRAELADDLAQLGAAEDALQSRVAADAAALLGAVRQKAAGALDAVSGVARHDLESKSAAMRHKREVGAAALLELDHEVAEFERQLAELDAETNNIVAHAVLEHARCTVGEAYRDALVSVRTLMSRLEGAERATGGGRYARVVAEVPAFGTSGHRLDSSRLPLGAGHDTIAVSAGDSDIADAAKAWRALAAAWLEDPQADPAEVLRFGPLCSNPTAGIAYHALHRLERHEVDVARTLSP